MEWGLLLQHSLIAGTALSAILTIIILISLRINPEMWLRSFPPDVKAAWGPMSDRARKQRNVVAALVFSTLIAVLALSTMRLAQLAAWESWFLAVLTSTAIIIAMFNTIDAVIIDWLMLTVLWPSLGRLPGTEGMAGYRDMHLQVANFFKGFIFVGIGSLLTAGIALLF